jgi:hypothetical protein
METKSFTSKDIKLAVSHLPQLSQRLIGIGKPYEPLLQEVIKIDPDGYDPLPTDKAMIKDLGITPTIFRKWIVQLYSDLIELLEDTDNPKLEINKLVHHITFQTKGKRFFFATILPETPRVGEHFYVDFFRPIYQYNHFYVDSISRYLMDGKMIVHIVLREQFLNGYVKFKEEKEEFEEWEKGSWYWYEWVKKHKHFDDQ